MSGPRHAVCRCQGPVPVCLIRRCRYVCGAAYRAYWPVPGARCPGRSAVQCSAVQCSAVQCSAVQCSAVQCSAVQCSAVQCSAVQVQCSAVQCSAVQCSAVQCSAVQCSAVQCMCSAVQCSALACGQGDWEGKEVDIVLLAMRSFPEAAFIGDPSYSLTGPSPPADLGANIGVYTVAVAALRPPREVAHQLTVKRHRKVVAVDADATNLAFFRRSLALGRPGSSVRLVHNAVRWAGC
jgi:hypothetical protein